jgi:hypothetical protein
MQKNIEKANKTVNTVSESIELSQKQVSECLKVIEVKITDLENRLVRD